MLLPIKDALVIAGSVQRRSNDSVVYDQCMSVVHKWWCERWEMMGQKNFARIRFKSVVLCNRSIDRCCVSLWRKGDPKPIIAYGDAKVAHT